MVHILLNDFRLARFSLTIKAGHQGLELPAYKGSTLRGGFGSAFKQIVCREQLQRCPECLVKDVCPYSLIFESSPPDTSEWRADSIPRPFVLEPPLTEQRYFPPGDHLTFSLVLFGKAITHLPYFVAAFRHLGRLGIGKGRKPFCLDQVSSFDQNGNIVDILYQDGGSIKNHPHIITGAMVIKNLNPIHQQITIAFETITRIRSNDSLTMDLSFQTLYRNTLRRLSALTNFYHDELLEYSYKDMIDASSDIIAVSPKLQWIDWERFSQRQDTRMKLGGFIGEITFRGDLTQFLPVILLGQYIHVGKATTFGLGKYRIIS